MEGGRDESMIPFLSRSELRPPPPLFPGGPAVCDRGSVSEGVAEGGGSVLGLCGGGGPSSFFSSSSLLDGAGGVISSLVRVLVFMLMKKNSRIYFM